MIDPSLNDAPFTTCDLYDEFGDRARVIGSQLHDYGGKRAFAGPAFTIKCFEDNSLVRETIQSPGNQRVLVIDGGGSHRCALLGDMLAKAALANGWAGIVVDGCVRDTAQLHALDIGIKARGSTPRKSHKLGEGQRDLPVTIMSVAILPGDGIFADADGIIILNPADADIAAKRGA